MSGGDWIGDELRRARGSTPPDEEKSDEPKSRSSIDAGARGVGRDSGDWLRDAIEAKQRGR